MKQILVVRDSELEVPFDVLTNYCAVIQKMMPDVRVLPIWPHGTIELIGDKRKMKLLTKELKELVAELEIELDSNK